MENLVKLLIKKLFHQIFLENILSGNIKDNEVEDYIRGIDDIEKKKLNKSKKVKKLIN